MRRDLYLNVLRPDIKREMYVFTAEEVQQAALDSKWGHLPLILVDSKYRALPIDIWKRIIERSQVNKRKYKSEFFDCDDFKDVIVGEVKRLYEVNGIGHVVDWSGGHAYNVLLVVKQRGTKLVLDLDWLEPQTDVIMDTSPAEGAYSMESGIILL